MRNPLPWFPLSDDPSRYSCRTTRGCRLYRSSLFGCRFGSSGSSGFVVGFSVFGCPVSDLWQGFVAVRISVDIGISAVPNESSFLFEAVFVVDEAGKGKRIGQGRLKVISDNLDILLGLDPTYAC